MTELGNENNGIQQEVLRYGGIEYGLSFWFIDQLLNNLPGDINTDYRHIAKPWPLYANPMNLRQLIILSLTTLLASCASENTVSSKDEKTTNWQSITFRLEDTAIVHIKHWSDSIEVLTNKGDTVTCNIRRDEKDSLIAWAEKLLDFKPPSQFRVCTDYVGKLSVQIKYSEIVSNRVDFRSICDWKRFNDETHKIDSVLQIVRRR